MILIASGAFLQGEFASEVGLIPPSFLPIGNKRLYEYQIEFVKHYVKPDECIYLSTPASYALDYFDKQRLLNLGVEVISVPEGLSLGNSILYCWNATARHHHQLTLLHGDTLFLDTLFNAENGLSVHANRGFYQRATLGKEIEALEQVHDDWSNDCEQVISGFFRFSNPLFFMKSLVESKGDFIRSIVNYHKTYPLCLFTEGDWLDFGHINSFYHSRTRMTTQRAFNDLQIGMRFVKKSSQDKPLKIYAEGNWFDQLPLPLRLYTPALLGLNEGKRDYIGADYKLEYLYLLPLSDLFVFSRLAKGCWQTIFKGIATMLDDFSSFSPNSIDSKLLSELDSLYLEKTLNRLQDFAKNSDRAGNLEVSALEKLALFSAKHINPSSKNDVVITHGDLCFSNMLFDSRVGAIKCIDPRGLTPNGELSLFGDRRYDLAKLYHSVIGLYDFIIAGRFKLNSDVSSGHSLNISLNESLYNDITQCFREQVLVPSGYEEKEVLAITIHLFLSMLPLHADRPERQQAFIANAWRLFEQLKEFDA